MNWSRPEQLQNLIETVRKGRLDDELSDEDITRLYSRIFKKCEEAGGTTSDDTDCHDYTYDWVMKRAVFGPPRSPPSKRDIDIEQQKDELGGTLKSTFGINDLTDINRWVVSCKNGYIKILPGDKILSRLYCPVCYERLWIDPHPEEVSRQKIDERTLKRLNRSETFLE